MQFIIKAASSLEKIFADEEYRGADYDRASVLRGEVFSMQLACRCDGYADVGIQVESSLGNITLREVGLVPCELPANDKLSDNVLRRTAGLYPDPLLPPGSRLRMVPRQWRSIWVTVRIPENEAPGTVLLRFKAAARATRGGEDAEAQTNFILDILEPVLPEQKLIHTEWFHADCIYHRDRCPCWSDRHWELLEAYFKNFASHGANMLLTPLWTPPLDTARGKERPTVQLLDISKEGDNYSFDFSLLEKWIDLALKCGVKYFEFSHPFTQWGAEHCPKIMAKEDGVEKMIFGWHTDSLGEEYRSFLGQLFPPLMELLRSKGLEQNSFFHISDEPSMEHIGRYKACSELILPLVGGSNVIDALSNIEFYRQGLVKTPVPGNDHIGDFVSDGVSPLWTYYCCGQVNAVPNRFFNFPSSRNRIMGVLMYLYKVAGFLQWGYNFWYSRLSENTDIDPYRVTDADRSFPSGDAFLVYPGENGPVDSIRHEVFFEALQDMRALQLHEELAGREETVKLIHQELDHPLSMTDYPSGADWLLNMRRRLNASISVLSR